MLLVTPLLVVDEAIEGEHTLALEALAAIHRWRPWHPTSMPEAPQVSARSPQCRYESTKLMSPCLGFLHVFFTVMTVG
jgi:hypothetical protein